MPKRFLKLKQNGEKIAALTAYDAPSARLQAAAGIDCILVGDSLGMVIQGKKDTLGVRLSHIVYHIQAVLAGAPDAFIIGDMPFGTYQASPPRAFANAAKLITAGAAMVKIEGGSEMAPTVQFLTQRGIPVCAHVGLLPQQIRASGGYAVQGRGEQEAHRVTEDARHMQQSGAAMVVLELLPQQLAAAISARLTIPTIGIGSGPHCDGQILVMHDILGLSDKKLRLARNFLADAGDIAGAFAAYVRAVKSGAFPAPENTVD